MMIFKTHINIDKVGNIYQEQQIDCIVSNVLQPNKKPQLIVAEHWLRRVTRARFRRAIDARL